MIVIGVDPHKSTHTATALNPATNSDVGSLRIDSSLAEYQAPEQLGQSMAGADLGDRERRRTRAPLGVVGCWLTARSSSTFRPRRPHVCASSPGAVVARTTASTLRRRPVSLRCRETLVRSTPKPSPTPWRLLDERRVNLSHSRTRSVNQLHALLRELLAGGAPTSLTPAGAAAALRGFRPQTGPDRIRVALAKDLIADIRRFDEQLAANAKTMTALLDEHGTRLREIDGVGPVLAARLLGRSGSPKRFVSAAAYANYTGTAPVQIASADSSQHRLSRYGDRQLNSAIYTVAMVQIRMPASTGRAYYEKKIAEGKSPRYATRALKRHLAGHLWRIMLADENRIVPKRSEATPNAS